MPKRYTDNKASIYARGLVNRLEKAVRAHEMMGAQPPEDHNNIEAELNEARKNLFDYLAKKEGNII